MTKIRKQKRRKRYRFSVNRKRMNKKKVPNPQSKIIKEAWTNRLSCQKNLNVMGLVYDVNREIGVSENSEKDSNNESEKCAPKTKVAEDLEKEAVTLRERSYRLPKSQVEYLTYLLNKYGEDYKAMAKDKRNVIQDTWKRIRSKINVFKSIPEQYNAYLLKKRKKH